MIINFFFAMFKGDIWQTLSFQIHLDFSPWFLETGISLHFEQMVLSCEWKVVEMIWIQHLCSIVGI